MSALPPTVDRHELSAALRTALGRSAAVALMGPRQLGKTTLARPFLSPEPPDYLDLEDPVVLQRLAESMAALSPLRGLVVIDQVQRPPAAVPVLRVLIDREAWIASFRVPRGAAPAPLKQPSESLAGRLEIMNNPRIRVARSSRMS